MAQLRGPQALFAVMGLLCVALLGGFVTVTNGALDRAERGGRPHVTDRQDRARRREGSPRGHRVEDPDRAVRGGVGDRNCASARASARSRSNPAVSPSSVRTRFSATSRPNSSSCASQTSPVPPPMGPLVSR